MARQPLRRPLEYDLPLYIKQCARQACMRLPGDTGAEEARTKEQPAMRDYEHRLERVEKALGAQEPEVVMVVWSTSSTSHRSL